MSEDTGSELHHMQVLILETMEVGWGGGSGNTMYIRLRTQSLEEDSQMTPASAEISCPISIIISSGGPVMVLFPFIPHHSTLSSGPRLPQGLAINQVCH